MYVLQELIDRKNEIQIELFGRLESRLTKTRFLAILAIKKKKGEKFWYL